MRSAEPVVVLIVAGLSLKNLHPRVWDADSPYLLPGLSAVMVSYADFHRMPARRTAAMAQGLHRYLGVGDQVRVYLDNGAFYFSGRAGEAPLQDYAEFVAGAKPDWYPAPRDSIPLPSMTLQDQLGCLARTMAINQAYQHDGYVPVIHISRVLPEYVTAMRASARLTAKPALALGGIVPNLLRTPKAMAYGDILSSLWQIRQDFAAKAIHVFGIGGTATVHLAALLAMDSIDSSGWRNRAARGIIQLPGSGDRVVAELGSWRGRRPEKRELERLEACPCPACHQFGTAGLRERGRAGFCNRATHNLWVLLNEAALVRDHLAKDTYEAWFEGHLDNSIYLPLIREALRLRHQAVIETVPTLVESKRVE